MSGVQRYHMRAEIDDREGVEIWPVKDDTGRLVMWEDHEAALAAARDEGYAAGYESGQNTDEDGSYSEQWNTAEDQGWNAALDAVLKLGLRRAVDVERLRKPPPQPEAPCECWLCHDANLTCDKCENCIVQAAAAQPEGGDRG